MAPRLMRIGTPKMRSTRCFFRFRSPQASYLEDMYMDNIPHHKDFTRSKPGDVSAFFCHFLAAVSRLSRFRPKGYLDPRGTRCSGAV